MSDRIEEELELLCNRWPNLTYDEDGRWVLLPEYPTPETIKQNEVAICFQIKKGHPSRAPYGFYVRKPIDLTEGGGFNNVTNASAPPFEGEWLKFSWKPDGWRPGASVQSGSNLANWVRTFYNRLAEGG